MEQSKADTQQSSTRQHLIRMRQALAREYILSDEGQINLAKGYARPIRTIMLNCRKRYRDILLPEEQYVEAQPVSDYDAWEEAAAGLGQRWQEEVLTKVK